MRRSQVLLAAAALTAATAAPALAASGASGASKASSVTSTVDNIVHVCALPLAGHMGCHALLNTTLSFRPHATGSAPSGLGPADLASAYQLPASPAGTGQTVAIVDAYDDPTAESDLAVYRSTYGLPACTTANGCFSKVNQNGATSPLPATDTGWAGEISLDVDMVSAACPACHILLVEANSASDADLYTAEDTAARLGATEISNSYGGSEYSGETADESHFNHPGIPITVSAGDSGYEVEFPAASRYVTAVGGTALSKASNARGWTETVWGSGFTSSINGGTGSGCSSYEPKPTWQKDKGCAKRTVADVAAVADPNTGVAVYQTTGGSGWAVYGGTSASSPIIASVYALAGNGASVTAGSFPYSHTSSLWDVTSGSNGSCGGLLSSSSAYLCKAQAGYDGPTGLGTPHGTGGF